MTKNNKFVGILIIASFLVGGSAFYFHKYDTRDYERKGFFILPILKPIWECKIEADQILKVGIITDTYVHPNRIDKKDKTDGALRTLFDKNLIPLKKIKTQMDVFQLEMLIYLSDIIKETNDKNFVGIMGLKLVREKLEKSGVPIYRIFGNHEYKNTSQICSS